MASAIIARRWCAGDAASLQHEVNNGMSDKNIPVKEKNIAVKEKNIPVKEKNIPVKEKNIPVKEKNIPVKEKNIPVDNSSPQSVIVIAALYQGVWCGHNPQIMSKYAYKLKN